MPTAIGTTPYRLAVATALAAAFLQCWVNLAVGIVGSEDNPVNLSFFLVVASAGACAFTARFRAQGMARAMVAAAGMQALVAAIVATAPSTLQDDPKGPIVVLVFSGGFIALWLLSAALFRRSARQQ